MRATSFNHVSLGATSIEESLAFYTEFLGMQQIPSPTFRHPTGWLRLGDQELHLYEHAEEPPLLQHVAINVDDFEAVYVRALALGIEDRESWGSHIYELPDGAVQLYVRDPAGNLIELDWPDAAALDRSIVTELPKLADVIPQADPDSGATIYLR